MSEVKNIKGLDDETWADFKSLAAKNKMKAADMFRAMVKTYGQKTTGAWDRIFKHKPIFTDKEYEEIERRIKSIRKEHGWRI